MKKILRVLCVGLALAICSFIGCKDTPKDTDDSSRYGSESSNGNEVELPDVDL